MWKLVVALACLATATAARAGGGGPATDAYEDVAAGVLDVHALADVYVQHDFGQPPSGSLASLARYPR